MCQHDVCYRYCSHCPQYFLVMSHGYVHSSKKFKWLHSLFSLIKGVAIPGTQDFLVNYVIEIYQAYSYVG